MQNYISHIKYIKSELSFGEIIECPHYERLIIEPFHPSYNDSQVNFSKSKFKYPYIPLYIGDYKIPEIENEDYNVNVLRLLIRTNDDKSDIYLPQELISLKEFILQQINYHRQYYSSNKNSFIYITVRTSTYKDLFYKESSKWHIDGFQGAKIATHIIEQDIFWCNKNPTQFLIQPMFCENLDSSKHDINEFFEKQANKNFIIDTQPNKIYLATPYNIHRVNTLPFEGKRVFIRLNFSPVEIEDFTNTINPMLVREYQKRRDVRDFLREYSIDEKVDSGLIF